MNTEKEIEQCLRAAPKPPAPERLLDRLQEDVSVKEPGTRDTVVRRWLAPAGGSISPWRVAAAAVIGVFVTLSLGYGAAKVIKCFTVGKTTLVVKNSDRINSREEAQKALEEFRKLYREGKAKEVRPGVWVVTLSNGEEFAFGGRHPELAGLPDGESKELLQK